MKRYAIGLAVDGTHTEIVLDKSLTSYMIGSLLVR
jgi:hypothetical protein